MKNHQKEHARNVMQNEFKVPSILVDLLLGTLPCVDFETMDIDELDDDKEIDTFYLFVDFTLDQLQTQLRQRMGIQEISPTVFESFGVTMKLGHASDNEEDGAMILINMPQ